MAAAVAFEGVTKEFTLHPDRPRSFKEAFVARFSGRRSAPERLVALDDVTFEVAKGDTMALVGPNGTGKSTALKLAAGILEPTSGVVRVTGRVAALLELGAGFHPDLTGRDNVFLNGSLMGLDRRAMAARLDRIVDFSELGRFIDMPVKHYSSGMYMRLGFATAIHVEPEVLLIDEVLGVGDQAFQRKCRERLVELKRSEVSILLVSHDIQAVRELCETALWLQDGKPRGLGPTDQVAEAYYRSAMAARGETGAPPRDYDAADRWGNGEVEITAVALVGPRGTPGEVLVTGQPCAVRIEYLARRRIEAPVFGVGIHRQDGVHVTGPNTKDDGLRIPSIEGRGVVTFELDKLPLTEGSYELSVSCYDWGCSEPFDYHHRRYPFRVRAGSLGQRHGLLQLDARWGHEAGAPAVAGPRRG